MSDTFRDKARGKIARGDDWRDHFPVRKTPARGSNHIQRTGVSVPDVVHAPENKRRRERSIRTTRTTERVMLGRLIGRLWAQDTELEVYIPPANVRYTD